MNDVIVVGAGPTGLMLAGELALAGIDVEVLERRTTAELVGTRARGFHARTIEIFDQRGIADRFLDAGQTVQGLRFGDSALDISSFPSRHAYTLGLGQSSIEQILLGWVEELGVPTVSLVTAQFKGLARTTARGRKVPELPVVVLPDLYDQLSEEEIRADIRSRLPEILGAMTGQPAPRAQPAEAEKPST